MSKRTQKLLVLLLCLLLVGAAGFAVVKFTKEKEETTETDPSVESFEIFKVDKDKIVHVDWVFGGFIEESFTKKDGKWVSDTSPDEFFYQEVFEEWLDRNFGSPWTSEAEVSSTDMDAMGFTDADTIAHVKLEDGTEYTLTFGASTTIQSTCYFTMDMKKVYVVPRGRKAAFGLKLANYQTTTTKKGE